MKVGLLLLSALLLPIGGCTERAAKTPIVVMAASSTRDAMAELARAFEAAHPTLEVVLSTAGSQVLSLQIEQGAPADVFISADPKHTQGLVALGLMEAPRVVAHNAIALAVPSHNPSGIESLADLPRARRLVIGTSAVPVGRYARQLLSAAERRYGPGFAQRALDRVASEETSAQLLQTRVSLGDADAALLYASALRGSSTLRQIPIDATLIPRAQYVAVQRESSPAGETFLRFMASGKARRILAAHGLIPAP